jgi:hypothetical protein
MNIDRIIKEEINRFILSEAIDFSNLTNYSNQLNASIGNLRNLNSNGFNEELNNFLRDLSIYGIQIIAAINRCAQANNLNEASWGNLSSYGINLPGELGGNLWSDAKEGYWKTVNFLNRNRNGGRKGYANGNRKGSNNMSGISSNTVPSEKLSVLLQALPQWEQRYGVIDAKYNVGDLTQEPYIMLRDIIPNIEREYNAQMQNAQVNP